MLVQIVGRDANAFQGGVITGVAKVLQRHGVAVPVFYWVDKGIGYFGADFDFKKSHFELEIYDEVAYVDKDGGRWDSWIFDYPTAQARIEDFIRRFDRLLINGTWYGPEDPSLLSTIKTHLRKVFSLN